VTDPLFRPLELPCGATLPNRIAKAPMTEGLADPRNRATERHERLYGRWAGSGAGLLVTGNVQVDRRYLERPGNVAVDANGGEEALRAFAAAGTRGGAHLWMQLGHAGRQSPRYCTTEPVAPSAVPIEGDLAAFAAPPRALEEAEIRDVIERFGRVAEVAKATGFTGVQVHAAHGYLLSEFLSPRVNRRADAWGGSLENRARLLLEVVRSVRGAVGPGFPVGVKLNSADFQQGGFTLEDSCRVVAMLGDEGVDLLEVSGGSYERPAMMLGADGEGASPVRESTRRREAYFLTYAQEIRKVARMPVMVTGGFRTGAAMREALEADELEVVGLGRPLVVVPDLGRQLATGALDAVPPGPEASIFWYYAQIFRMGDGLDPDPDLDAESAPGQVLQHEIAAAQALER